MGSAGIPGSGARGAATTSKKRKNALEQWGKELEGPDLWVWVEGHETFPTVPYMGRFPYKGRYQKNTFVTEKGEKHGQN